MSTFASKFKGGKNNFEHANLRVWAAAQSSNASSAPVNYFNQLLVRFNNQVYC